MSYLIGPLVSVVIPTFNHAEYLARALQSVVDQTYSNWEAIIIDNHSTDNTDEVISKFFDSRIKYIKIHNHGVIAASRNCGISQAKGEWIAFLDSDDWWLKNKIKDSLKVALEENADFIFHNLYVVKHASQKFFLKKTNGRQLRDPIFEDLLEHGNLIPNSSVMVKKTILEKIGKLSIQQDKISWEDFDCWLRISRETSRFRYISKPLGYYWAGGGNFTNPERTISNCKAISKYYTNIYSDRTPFWLKYSYGVALLEGGFYKESMLALLSIEFKNISFLNVIKCIIKIINARLKNLIN